MAGRRIDDHAFWAGSKPRGTVFPEGPHKLKEEVSANGAGGVSYYEDTTESLKKSQEMAKAKVHGHPRKNEHRN